MTQNQTRTEWPKVSVVIVSFNGLQHLEPCLGSVRALDYPRDAVEVVLVDNGSTDGSADFVRTSFPEVQVVRNDRNLGFAGASNIGARAASGRYVAFLNNDTRVDPKWISELVDAVESKPGVVCAGSKILSWDGRTVDFVGGSLNFHGYGFQTDYGLPHLEGAHSEEKYLLFACGAAMLIDRQVFLDAGGFDDDYFAYFEDIDLGWRLWLFGYAVVFAPGSVVYHRHHGTTKDFSQHRYRMVCERNALYTIFKNYDEGNLEKALPTALLLSARRALWDSRVQKEQFELSGSKKQDTRTSTVPNSSLSGLVAMNEFIEALPRLTEKRRFVQSKRRRSDLEVFERFQEGLSAPVVQSAGYIAAQNTLVNHLGLPSLFRQRLRILLICHDIVSEKMAGPGVRYWEMARALSHHFDVTLAAPGEPKLKGQRFEVKGYVRSDPGSIASMVDDADVVLVFGFVLHFFPLLESLDKPLIVDIYDPFTLEDLEVYGGRPIQEQAELISRHTGVINHQLRTGDFFLCASERQRDYWLGMLSANLRINPRTYGEDKTLRRLIDVVPFGLPEKPPRHTRQVLKGVHPGIAVTDKVILWGGGIWEWLDPLTLVRAMAKIVSQRGDIKLFFLGKQHFDPTTAPETGICAATIRLCEELGMLHRQVFFNDWTPYEDRQNYLMEADIGVCLHPNHIETRFAFRTRILDYMWAGLPIVTSGGDATADIVQKYQLGQVVGNGDVDGVVTAILQLVDTPNLREVMQPRFQAAAQDYTWGKAVEPIVRWCAEPRRAADRELSIQQTGSYVVWPAKPTPVWALPGRAWHFLRTTGVSGLAREVRSYLRWRLGDYG